MDKFGNPCYNLSETEFCCWSNGLIIFVQHREKKMDGMKCVADLAQHHPEQLKTKLHEVCRVLTEEVQTCFHSAGLGFSFLTPKMFSFFFTFFFSFAG